MKFAELSRGFEKYYYSHVIWCDFVYSLNMSSKATSDAMDLGRNWDDELCEMNLDTVLALYLTLEGIDDLSRYLYNRFQDHYDDGKSFEDFKDDLKSIKEIFTEVVSASGTT